MCEGVSEEGIHGYYNPEPQQVVCLEAARIHPWLLVNKYRQAKISTAMLLGAMLPTLMYTRGQFGYLMADTERTTTALLRRITKAYDGLPDVAKTRIERRADTYIRFENGSEIQVVPAGSPHPGIGQSIDYMHLSEECAYENQKIIASDLMPAIEKRPNSRAVRESTPGKKDSIYEKVWLNAIEAWGYESLSPKEDSILHSRWFPVFLKWWEDPTCSLQIPRGFRLDNTELRFLEQFPFLTTGNMVYRRNVLVEFGGDDRLFRNKYPMSPWDGWLGSFNPVMPEDAIQWLLESFGKSDGDYDFELRCNVFESPREGDEYIVTADPHGYGATGDPAAFTVWKKDGRIEVANWEGREDPGLFAERLIHVSKKYNNALLVIESNAAATIATVQRIGYPNIYWTSKDHPGWYATDARLIEAEARTAKILRDKDLIIRSYKTLHQGRDYDGSKRNKRDGEGGHFDRWRTVIMAADLFLTRLYNSGHVVEQPKEALENYSREDPGEQEHGFSSAQLDWAREQEGRKVFRRSKDGWESEHDGDPTLFLPFSKW